MSLPHILPAPTQTFQDPPSYRGAATHNFSLQSIPKPGPPIYGSRKGWIPRCLEDFGDGGAFPEIPVAQYPMNMGRKSIGSNSNRSIIPLQMDKEGHIKYDAVVYQGQRKDKVSYSILCRFVIYLILYSTDKPNYLLYLVCITAIL